MKSRKTCHRAVSLHYAITPVALLCILMPLISSYLVASHSTLSINMQNSGTELFLLLIVIIKNTISSIVIGLKSSYYPLIYLPSCYRTVCYRTVQ